MVNSITTTSAITAAFPVLNPEKQKKADDIKAVLQQTLDSLKNGKSDINEQRKAAAAQRVAQLKNAIKNLRQVAGMDPKAMARMLAMLAKQLAAAVKDYKAAGGSDNAVSAGASAGSASASSSDLASSDPAVDNEADTSEMASQDIEGMPASPANLFGQGVNAYNRTQTITTRSGNKDEDYAFLGDAKSLLGEMKGMLEAQRQRIKRDKGGSRSAMDPDFNPVRSADKALDEVEKTLRTIQLRSFSV